MTIIEFVFKAVSIAAAILAAIVIIFFGIVGVAHTVEEGKKINLDWSDKYFVVCVNGHEYYTSYSGRHDVLAVRLDDNGKPIKCDRKAK